MSRVFLSLSVIWTLLLGNAGIGWAQTAQIAAAAKAAPDNATKYRTLKVNGLDIFYREAGSPENPTVLLLHGFPSSSHMYRNLIPALADKYHVLAPDYPGFGNSSMPKISEFEYTFDNLTGIVEKFLAAKNVQRFSIYVQDYGAPVGFRLAARNPKRIQAIVTQNGNAYEEGLTPFWGPFRDAFWKLRTPETEKPLLAFLTLDGTKYQYLTGAANIERISPDGWLSDQMGLDRPGNRDIQLALFYDYRTNPPLYATWHEYFRKSQPPTLVVWGKNDPIFGEAGARAFQRHLPKSKLHLLNTGHFALEEEGDTIARLMRAFLSKNVR